MKNGIPEIFPKPTWPADGPIPRYGNSSLDVLLALGGPTSDEAPIVPLRSVDGVVGFRVHRVPQHAYVPKTSIPGFIRTSRTNEKIMVEQIDLPEDVLRFLFRFDVPSKETRTRPRFPEHLFGKALPTDHLNEIRRYLVDPFKEFLTAELKM